MPPRAERGLWNGGRAPLGYRLEPGGRLAPEPDETAIVQAACSRYAELRSSVRLAAWLDAQGYRQKRRGARAAPAFTVNAVQYLLQNRVYIGEIEHNGARFTGQHPPIVSPELFQRVQEIVEANAKNLRGPPLRAQHRAAPQRGPQTCMSTC